jgi:redox-sensitive bicupin YhaK (pirin superfamily)
MMCAGKGVLHSEFNPSDSEISHLLQIWIQPDQRGLVPSYTEWHPDPAKDQESKVLVISREGRENSASIHQDADVFRVRLGAAGSVIHEVKAGRGVWFQLIRGSVNVDGSTLQPGDALSTEDAGTLTITATEDAEALLFDLG